MAYTKENWDFLLLSTIDNNKNPWPLTLGDYFLLFQFYYKIWVVLFTNDAVRISIPAGLVVRQLAANYEID